MLTSQGIKLFSSARTKKRWLRGAGIMPFLLTRNNPTLRKKRQGRPVEGISKNLSLMGRATLEIGRRCDACRPIPNAGGIHKMRSPILILLLCALLVASQAAQAAPQPAQDVPGALTLGLVLNHLMDQLQQAIEAARNAGLSLEMEAGRDATIAIQNAQNAYAASLDKTMDRVDQTTRQTIDQLSSLVNDVTHNVFHNLDEVTQRVQQIVDSLPFRNQEPQLTKISPRFVVPSRTAYPAIIRLDGNFEASARPGFAPVLKVGAESFPATALSTQALAFSVPVNKLFPGDAGGSLFAFTSINVEVPWESCSVRVIWCWAHKRETDTYKLYVGALPHSPGKLTMGWRTSHSQRNVKQYISPAFYLSSASDGGNNDHIDVPFSVHAEPGWHIQMGSSSFSEANPPSEGERSHTFVSDDGDVAIYRVTTIHKAWGTSGKTLFSIVFTEYQDVDVPDDHSEMINLAWGDSKVFNYPLTTWKLSFDAFDGAHSEFVNADDTNRFVKVRNTGGGFVLSTADPAALVWP
jgi:hypothetical protein